MNISNNIKPPCKDCISRSVGCHSNCSEYSIYQDRLNAFREQRNMSNKVNRDVIMSKKPFKTFKNFLRILKIGVTIP